MDERAADKKKRVLDALERGKVRIHLDARRPGVKVPAPFKGEAFLGLELSYAENPTDLSVTEWGVRATLVLGGARSKVAVPWSALFAIFSYATQQPWMYPGDLPAEAMQQAPPSPSSRPAGGVRATHPDNPESKRARLEGSLEHGKTLINLDARRPGVSVPPHLADEACLGLNLSYRFAHADLSLTDWGVRSTLNFPDGPFKVAVPWSALFAIYSYASEERWVYLEHVPAEFLQPGPAPRAAPTVAARGAPTCPPSPSQEENPGAALGSKSPDAKPATATRPHLKLVK